MKKIGAVVFVIIIIAVALVIRGNQSCSFSGFYFDTAVSCKIIADKDITDVIKGIAENADKRLSAFGNNSDASAINNGGDFSAEKYPEIASLIKGYCSFEEKFGRGVSPFCGSITRLWKSASDNSQVPDKNEITAALENVYYCDDYSGNIPEGALLDFGSGAKGYVCDEIFKAVSTEQCDEIVFSASSSALLWSANGRKFTTSVINPFSDSSIEILTGNAFVSTSGGYERYFEADGKKYSHIIDLDSGYPVETDIASATVILPCEYGNGLASDLLSTLVYIGGTDKAEDYSGICSESFSDYGILIITSDGEQITYGSVSFAE